MKNQSFRILAGQLQWRGGGVEREREREREGECEMIFISIDDFILQKWPFQTKTLLLDPPPPIFL